MEAICPHNEGLESLDGRKPRRKGDMKQREKDGGRDTEIKELKEGNKPKGLRI